jgi:isocitrate dehydrogenase
VGKGARSLNVRLRKIFDLYACVRPVCHLPNVPSPMKRPENVNMTIFRENTEDIYAGIEFEAGSFEAAELRQFINLLLLRRDGEKANFLPELDFALGIKPISEKRTKRLMRRAIEFALREGQDSVTIVHKANIQKFTDGGFLKWAYEVAAEEYGSVTITEDQLKALNWVMPSDKKLVVKDRIIDNMFQQTKIRPQNYRVLVMENLYGDIMSDDLAGLIGGLGVAGGINIGDNSDAEEKDKEEFLIAEATHGTAPDIVGQNKANPTSLILSGLMLLEYMKWDKAADLARAALLKTFEDKVMTGELANDVPGSTMVGTVEFTAAVKERMTALAGGGSAK